MGAIDATIAFDRDDRVSRRSFDASRASRHVASAKTTSPIDRVERRARSRTDARARRDAPLGGLSVCTLIQTYGTYSYTFETYQNHTIGHT